MAEDEVSKSGVFFDTKNQKIVEEAPEEGVQLVAPGSVITPSDKVSIDAYRDVVPNEVDEAVVDEDVDTASTAPAKSSRARK